MDEYRNKLKRVGAVLIIVGLLDIVALIYCISNCITYSSSLNIFAVIAGIFLYRESLKAARVIALICAILFAAFGTMIFVSPFVMKVPLDFLLTSIKLKPAHFAGFSLFVVFLFSLLLWTYLQLTSREVYGAIVENGINVEKIWRKPKNGFAFGAAFTILLSLLVFLGISDETRIAVKAEAAKKVGHGYKYYVSSIQVSYTNGVKEVTASVMAYNDNDIKELEITLDK